MNKQENPMNIQGAPQNQPPMQMNQPPMQMNQPPMQMNQPPMQMNQPQNVMPLDMAQYPDTYYRIQPFVLSGCDEMDMYPGMPSPDMMDNMTDRIYDDVRRMYPDMDQGMENEAQETIVYPDYDNRYDRYDRYDRYGRRGNRNPLRDLIYILLLSEMRRRRRRYY
ncbi:MAG: hypothetical protein Q8865_02280 [Bacillota bacterium]|nr:hypothetical protein [Bacillota bacterium]